LIGKPEGKRPSGKPRRRWEDNVRTDLREIMWKDVDWKLLVHDRDSWWDLANTGTNFWVP
jgi:hypothetical protein